MKDRLESIADHTFDILVVGGGIFGVGVAREAALNGARVALLEQGDLAASTSSASSKLLHGGLRYLETFEFSLVKQALRERAVQWELAPHLARPCPFLAPVYEGARVSKLKLRAGLFLYDFLSRTERRFRRKMFSAADLRAAEPNLESKDLLGGGRYYDWQTFDSRMVSEVALSAREHGAQIATRAQVIDVRPARDRKDLFTVEGRDLLDEGRTFTLTTRAVVGSVGPWSDAFRSSSAHYPVPPRTRLTTGVHVVVPRVLSTHATVLNARSDGRVFFLLPFEDRTLIGTTDRDYVGDPADLAVSEEDIEYLLTEANHALQENARLSREDVISSFIGLRTLALDNADHPSKTSREQVIWEEPKGIVHVVGGKFTTWRLIARELTEHAASIAGFSLDSGKRSRKTRLPGGEDLDRDPRRWTAHAEELTRAFDVPEDVAWRLLHRYGSRAKNVLALGREDETLLQPISNTLPELGCEVHYLAKAEQALTLEDIFRRRLPRFLTDRVSDEDQARAESVLAAALRE